MTVPTRRFHEYQDAALAIGLFKENKIGRLATSAMGLAGETGEVIDIIKKHFEQGRELDKEKLKEELGDVLWYVADLCTYLGLNMADVAAANIKKLTTRYPERPTAEASKNRKCDGSCNGTEFGDCSHDYER